MVSCWGLRHWTVGAQPPPPPYNSVVEVNVIVPVAETLSTTKEEAWLFLSLFKSGLRLGDLQQIKLMTGVCTLFSWSLLLAVSLLSIYMQSLV